MSSVLLRCVVALIVTNAVEIEMCSLLFFGGLLHFFALFLFILYAVLHVQ